MASRTTERSMANDASKQPVLLSGGNPQIPKGYGEAPVQAYLDAVPGWKRRVCRRLDALITQAIPDVKKAVKWNTPLYGVEEHHYVAGYHCMTKYVKVSFFQGAHRDPVPPGKSKQAHIRYLDIHEQDELDEVQFKTWVQQAAQLPGEKM
jgi:hypothetical protein